MTIMHRHRYRPRIATQLALGLIVPVDEQRATVERAKRTGTYYIPPPSASAARKR